MRLSEVTQRLNDRVTALEGRILHAGDWAEVVKNNRISQVTPAAFVLPGGYSGGEADVAAGLFRQALSETVLVIVAVRVAGDSLHARAIDEVKPIVQAAIRAVAGWGPDDAPGVFVLSRGDLVGAMDGLLIFQLDFVLTDQLRITS